ncbi:MAG: T9SS type A sorting domain-containing protein [Candidatus Marinimicrobia bacterium]|nr:T9SS type A sorting domain-containing protein [Candidatus Neomarinimicrobiota bacterium]MDD5582286.1 T9SS type A sorting domain-containing protein [Candidatus Neomarinimicrobiota bacterium]
MIRARKFIYFLFLTSVLYGGPGRLIPPSKDGIDYRPQGLDQHYTTSSGIFILHYTNTGSDSVPQSYTLNEIHPDYILYAGQFLDRGYRFLTDTLALPQPPVDDIKNPEIDIYFRKLPSGTYGQTTAEMSKILPNRPKAYTAFSEIHHTLQGPGFYTQGIDALKVTCIHELFHVFQVGIAIWNLQEDMWFYETSATWIEEIAYPTVNDYFQYVESYVSTWGDPIYTYIYDNVTWLLYLDAWSQRKAVSNIWTSIATQPVWTSITAYLTETSGSHGWPKHLAAWGIEHLYADYLPELSLFDDAPEYPPIPFPEGTFKSYTYLDSFSVITYAEPYSSSFYKILSITTPALRLRILSPGKIWGKAWVAGSHTKAIDLSSNFVTLQGLNHPWDLLIALGTDSAYALDEPLRITIDIRKGETSLIALYPNPIENSQSLTLIYHVKEDLHEGTLIIYDLLGREIMHISLSPEEMVAGIHFLTLNVSQIMASGIYFLVLTLEDKTFPLKFTLLQ